MKLSTILSFLALGSALAFGSVVLSPSFAGESRTAPAGERQWLSIPQVYEKLEAAGYRNVEKIEREHGGYEARATDRNGERLKLHVNPQTGEIMNQRTQGKRATGPADQSLRDSADCNKRRCRDDLPQKTVVTTPASK
jgi:hypothetical protein